MMFESSNPLPRKKYMFTTLQKLNLLTPILLALNVSAEIDFAHEVLPILKENCVKCHSNGKKKGGLSMETRESVLDSETIAVGKAGVGGNRFFMMIW
ncbi:hypothetical protein N9077_02475 [bacterium]|nr:hypothetical protein [bacterium]